MNERERREDFYASMSGQPSHAWLLTGRGALAGAEGGAARLLCTAAQPESKPCGACKGCKMRLADSHPDYRALRQAEDGKTVSIKVEEIRSLRDWLGQAPQYGRKVLVMEDAQRMTEAAQNALLRSLEEPPPDCFFLLTGEEGGLLPTLRSRMNPLRLGGEEKTDYSAQWDAAEAQIRRALAGDWAGLHEGYGKKKADMLPLLYAQAERLREMIGAALRDPAAAANPVLLNRWLALTLEAAERLNSNANPSMTADWLGIGMKRARG